MPVIRLATLAVALVALGSLATPAASGRAGGVSTIPRGFDLFESPPLGTSFDFGGSPLVPAGFFGPGSQPFDGKVALSGVPLGEFIGTTAGTADTIIQRRADMSLPGPGGSDTIPIELVALNLVSVQPITVTYPAPRRPEPWNVIITPSPTRKSTGSLKVDQSSPSGGTFEATINVRPLLTFVGPTGQKKKVDLGLPQYDAQSRLIRETGRGDWTLPGCPTGVYYVDVIEFGGGWCPLFKPAGASATTLRGRLFPHRIGPARWVEIDHFPDSKARLKIITPSGGDATVDLTGPATIRVVIGPDGLGAGDTDGDGREQVQTEIIAMDLRGTTPLGPVRVTIRPHDQHPFRRSLGEIEEHENETAGLLDLAPFHVAPAGGPPFKADSSFDVFVEVKLQGKVQHTDKAKRMKTVIEHKPPEPFARYFSPQVIPLFDRLHQPTGFKLGAVSHTPRPFEVDFFDATSAFVEVLTPQGPVGVDLEGTTEVKVHIGENGEATDLDDDGLDEVRTEMIGMHLMGSTPLGPIEILLRDPAAHPRKRSLGRIEERVNTTPGVLDTSPFGAGGLADSSFDVFFEVRLGPERLHSHRPKRMKSVISHKPPGPGDIYFSPTIIPLFKENEKASGFSIGATHHIPIPPREFEFEAVAANLLIHHGITPVSAQLGGNARVAVYTDEDGTAFDRDGDGLDEAPMRLMDLALDGTSMLGPIELRTRSPGLHPGMGSFGWIEGNVNTTPGRLDIPPSGLGIGQSFFDVFLELQIGTTLYHNHVAQGLKANIGSTPAGPGDEFQDTSEAPLQIFTSTESPAPVAIFDLRITLVPATP